MQRIWRIAIALVLAGGAWAFFRDPWVRFLSGPCEVDDWADALVGKPYSDPLLGAILPVLVALFAYGLLSLCPDLKTRFDGETRCRKCGYNLTGNVSGICPECGEKI
jgi:hypothetical protein